MLDRPPPSLLLRMVLHLAIWAATVTLCTAAIVHMAAPDASVWLAALHAATGVLYLPALALFPVALYQRLGAPAVLLGAVSLCWVTWMAPVLAPGQAPPFDTTNLPTLRVASANVLAVHPAPAVLLDSLLAEDPDVLLLQEFSPQWKEAMAHPAIAKRYPYSVHEVRSDPFGVAIYSRYPLASSYISSTTGVPVAHATVRIGQRSVALASVHARPPLSDGLAAAWQRDLQEIQAMMWASSQPTLIAGDFNLSRHSPAYKTLAWTSFRDAHTVAGRRGARTWPAVGVPLLRPDQMWVNDGLAVIEIWEGSAAGSDHLPLFIDVAIRH